MVLPKRPFFQSVGDVTRDRHCPCFQGYRPLKVTRLILLVTNRPPIAIQIVSAGSPAQRIEGRCDAVHLVRS